jgi:enoyl-CoA hydratase/carnithine racemase
MALTFGDLRPTHLQCTIEDGIGWIRLNRPPVNAIDLALLQELVQAVQAARVDPGVKAVMIASQIPGYFSAGLDLKELEHSSDEGRAELLDQLFKDGLLHAMRTARKVFVALINGHCLGGGLEVALAADFRIGAQGKWQIGLPEVRLGGMPGGGGIQMLGRLIGQSRTLRLTLLGETITPDRAQEYGILDALYPEADALLEASAFVRKFADGPGHSIGAIKLALYEGREIPLTHALVLERQLYRAINMGDDIQEGIRAFREKRPPRFTGR